MGRFVDPEGNIHRSRQEKDPIEVILDIIHRENHICPNNETGGNRYGKTHLNSKRRTTLKKQATTHLKGY